MTVRREVDGHVWTVLIDRPAVRNAIDPATAQSLYDHFLAFDEDPEARVAVLHGGGGAFSAGWDLVHGASLADADRETARRTLLAEIDPPADGATATRAGIGPTRLELSKPVIAAVEGPAVAGGMELAIWADVRVMASTAFMGVYCRRWGVPLIDGGTVRLPRLVGEGRALELTLTGREVTADECLRIGLCERVVAPGTARAVAEEMAQDIARFPQAALRADRRSIRATHGLSVSEGLRREWAGGVPALLDEGLAGAARFAAGLGRGGDRDRI